MKHDAMTALILIGATTLGTAARAAPGGSPQRGSLLYEDHCTGCHESIVHIRSHSKATNPQELRQQVARWARLEDLGWGSDELRDVYVYLNTNYYHFKQVPPKPKRSADTAP